MEALVTSSTPPNRSALVYITKRPVRPSSSCPALPRNNKFPREPADQPTRLPKTVASLSLLSSPYPQESIARMTPLKKPPSSRANFKMRHHVPEPETNKKKKSPLYKCHRVEETVKIRNTRSTFVAMKKTLASVMEVCAGNQNQGLRHKK